MYGKKQTNNLKKILEEKKLSALLLFNGSEPQYDPNFYYFTGLLNFESSVAILGAEDSVYVPGFEVTRAKKDSWIRGVEPLPEKALETIAKGFKKQVGVNMNFISANLHARLKKVGLKLVDVSKDLEKLRMIKTAEEVKFLEDSAAITMKLFSKVDSTKTERQIKTDLACELARKGSGFSFDPIVAYDANAAMPHAEAGDALGKNVLLVDTGAIYNGYCSDVARTFKLKKDIELEMAYELVQEANDLGVAAVAPGVKTSEVDKVVRDKLNESGYELIHATGHGVGLTVHEGPSISEWSKDVLEEGMVFTIEPGVYVEKKFGVRIEDMVLVTKEGCRVLTK